MMRFFGRRVVSVEHSFAKQRTFSTPIYSTVHQPAKLGTSLSKYGVNLSKYAADGKLDPGTTASYCYIAVRMFFAEISSDWFRVSF